MEPDAAAWCHECMEANTAMPASTISRSGQGRRPVRRRIAAGMAALRVPLIGASEPVHAGATPNMVVVLADGRLVVARNQALGAPVPGMVSDDGTAIVTTAAGAAGVSTTVTFTTLATDTASEPLTLDGALQLAAVDRTARWAALVADVGTAGAPKTEVVVTSAVKELFRMTYDGRIEPEAFEDSATEDGTPYGLYVIQYLAPTRTTGSTAATGTTPPTDTSTPYAVRRIELTNGDIGLPVNLRDKSQFVDQRMAAEAQNHVVGLSPYLRYTLYRGRENGEPEPLAFIHTLGLHGPYGVWCLDIDPKLDLLHRPGSLAVVGGGAKLLVASANGMLAVYDAKHLTEQSETEPEPVALTQVWTPTDPTKVPVMAVIDDAVVLAQGRELRWFFTGTLKNRSVTSRLGGDVDAIAAFPSGSAKVVVAIHGTTLAVAWTTTSFFEVILPGLVPDGTRAVRIVPFANR